MKCHCGQCSSGYYYGQSMVCIVGWSAAGGRPVAGGGWPQSDWTHPGEVCSVYIQFNHNLGSVCLCMLKKTETINQY